MRDQTKKTEFLARVSALAIEAIADTDAHPYDIARVYRSAASVVAAEMGEAELLLLMACDPQVSPEGAYPGNKVECYRSAAELIAARSYDDFKFMAAYWRGRATSFLTRYRRLLIDLSRHRPEVVASDDISAETAWIEGLARGDIPSDEDLMAKTERLVLVIERFASECFFSNEPYDRFREAGYPAPGEDFDDEWLLPIVNLHFLARHGRLQPEVFRTTSG